MKVTIRKEILEDIHKVSELVEQSFKNGNTRLLTEMLRERDDFVEELSLVAEINEMIIGYILLSPVYIQTKQSLVNALWMEPVCVSRHCRNKGIGGALIKEAVDRGRKLGYESVFVTGALDYYSRFGFRKACDFGITSSIAVPLNAFLAIELKEKALQTEGELIYPPDIFD